MSKYPKSPLAPEALPKLPPIAGVRMVTAQAGIKYAHRTDLLLMAFDQGTVVAGVFTKSLAPSTPVDWCRAQLPKHTARALLVNSGNANAFTGKRGVTSVQASADALVKTLNIKPYEIYLASTGVIGEPLPHDKIEAALPNMPQGLKGDGWHEAAAAIMTTDTFPKAATRTVKLSDGSVTINGIAKGSGMIAPDMATMLAFVATDAKIDAQMLQEMLQQSCSKSFNSITVDGDTSTSDTLMLFATGKGAEVKGKNAELFLAALTDIMIELAKLVAMDGEGAQKLITVNVTGATSDESAKRIALSIANSPLVKTAIAGEDANWGRVVMAVGKSGEKVDRDLLSVSIGGVLIASKGERVAQYDEAPVTAHMKTRDIHIEADIGLGNGSWTVWTCDLTHGYISINADYRS
ncbi:MAG: bifunctional glutamate N-acetyltransferase/amino-acid acetyltransferase ArgJ [Rickettsiales bacterium]